MICKRAENNSCVVMMLDQSFVVTVFVVTVMNWCNFAVTRGAVVIGTSAWRVWVR